MNIEFRTKKLKRLAHDESFHGDYPQEIVKKYRMRVNFIEQAVDERDLRAMRSNRFEKLKGDRSHQHSMRLNDQWRLILEIEGEDPDKVVTVVDLEDYH